MMMSTGWKKLMERMEKKKTEVSILTNLMQRTFRKIFRRARHWPYPLHWLPGRLSDWDWLPWLGKKLHYDVKSMKHLKGCEWLLEEKSLLYCTDILNLKSQRTS